MNMCHVSGSYPTLRAMPSDRLEADSHSTPARRRVPARRSAAGAGSRTILDAAARLVVERGVEALTHPRHREAAGVPGRLALPVLRRQGGRAARPRRARHGRDGRAGRRRPGRARGRSRVATLVRTTMEAFVRGLPPAPRLRGDLPARAHQRRRAPVRPRAQRAASPQMLREFAIDAGPRRRRPRPRGRACSPSRSATGSSSSPTSTTTHGDQRAGRGGHHAGDRLPRALRHPTRAAGDAVTARRRSPPRPAAWPPRAC